MMTIEQQQLIAEAQAFLYRQYVAIRADIEAQFQLVAEYRNAALAEIESARIQLLADRDKIIAEIEAHAREHGQQYEYHEDDEHVVLN